MDYTNIITGIVGIFGALGFAWMRWRKPLLKLLDLYWVGKEAMKDGSISQEERKALVAEFDEFIESITTWKKAN